MDLRTLADRIEINDLLTRYAHAVDTKDWALYRTVFTPDAYVDRTGPSTRGIRGDIDTVAPWVEKSMANYAMTQHLISNIDVKLDGDSATVRAMFYNPMRPLNGEMFFCGGWYTHELVRTTEGWKSRRLVIEHGWFDSKR